MACVPNGFGGCCAACDAGEQQVGTFGAIAYDYRVAQLQTTLNRLAKYMKLSTITVDGKAGTKTATLLQAVVASLSVTAASSIASSMWAQVFGPALTTAYIVENAQFFDASLVGAMQYLGILGTPGDPQPTTAELAAMQQARVAAGVPRQGLSTATIVITSVLIVGIAGAVILSG